MCERSFEAIYVFSLLLSLSLSLFVLQWHGSNTEEEEENEEEEEEEGKKRRRQSWKKSYFLFFFFSSFLLLFFFFSANSWYKARAPVVDTSHKRCASYHLLIFVSSFYLFHQVLRDHKNKLQKRKKKKKKTKKKRKKKKRKEKTGISLHIEKRRGEVLYSLADVNNATNQHWLYDSPTYLW